MKTEPKVPCAIAPLDETAAFRRGLFRVLRPLLARFSPPELLILCVLPMEKLVAIAAATGLGSNTVYLALRGLMEAGIVESEGEPKKVNLWKLTPAGEEIFRRPVSRKHATAGEAAATCDSSTD